MNQILVIRFSTERHSVNPKLREALKGNYHPDTPMFAIPAGGMISALITPKTFDEIRQIVTDADCGEPVRVVDALAMAQGDFTKDVLIQPALTADRIGLIPEENIQEKIDELVEKSRNNTITDDEKVVLERLLASDPR